VVSGIGPFYLPELVPLIPPILALVVLLAVLHVGMIVALHLLWRLDSLVVF
jgi:hypothetical protein